MSSQTHILSYRHQDPVEFIMKTVGAVGRLNQSPNFRYYIFGGCVRDRLRQVTPTDYDVFISNANVAKDWVDLLGSFGFLVQKRIEKSKYAKYRLEIQLSPDKNINVDVVTNDLILKICDFTCNNLTLDVKGAISYRLPPPKEMEKISSSEWTFKCINDAIQGKLIMMVNPNMVSSLTSQEREGFYLKINYRFKKMLDKGFTFEGKSLTSFKMLHPATHRDIPEGKDISSQCAICHDCYSDEPNKETLLLNCLHDFHTSCFSEWRKKNKKCPICRQNSTILFVEK